MDVSNIGLDYANQILRKDRDACKKDLRKILNKLESISFEFNLEEYEPFKECLNKIKELSK